MAKKRQQNRSSGKKAVAAPPAEVGMDLWDRIAWTCLHLVVLLVPIAMSNFGPFAPNGLPLTFDQFDIVKVVLQRGLLLIAASAWLIGLLLRGGRVRFTRGEWLLLAFLGWLVLTTVVSVHPPTAIFGKYRRFEGLISFVTYGIAFFMAFQLADRPARMRSLARTLVIGGFLVAVYGTIQVVGGVSLGVARVLQPVAVIATVVAPLAMAYFGWRRQEDVPSRDALWMGAAIALLGGIVFSAGLAQNIALAVERGLTTASIDPVQWGTLPFESHRAFSTFGNPDLLGGYLIFPWAVSLGLALSEKHPLWRSIYWVFALLNVFVGITSYVRGAWIGATVSLVLIVVAYVRARKGTQMRLSPTDRTFIGGTALVAASVMIASSLRPDAVRNVLTRVMSIFQFSEGSAFTRFRIWEAAAAAIAERPLFGWGADTFRLLFPMFKPAEYVRVAGFLSVADNVHNYPLQLASGIGIPGALMFYGLITLALVLAARTAFAKGSEARNLVYAGFWAAVAGYVVHLMFGLSVTGSTVIMWLVMGVLLVPTGRTIEVRRPSWGIVGVTLVLVVLATGTALNTRYFVAETHYLKGRTMAQGIERVEEIERAITLNPYNEMYKLELGAAWRELFSAGAQQYATTVEAGDPDTELRDQLVEIHALAQEAYEDVIEYVPQEYDTYVFLSYLHNEAAAYVDPSFSEDAIEVAEKGIEVEEYGPAVRVQLSIALLTQNRVDEAIEQLVFATDLDPAYTQAWLLLSDAYVRLGRYEEAVAVLQKVLAMHPNSVEARAQLEAIEATLTP
jgi:tetratricopeptide (TPR) repeat protein